MAPATRKTLEKLEIEGETVMRTMIRNVFAGLALTVALGGAAIMPTPAVLGAVAGDSDAQAKPSGKAKRLAGTWLVQVSLKDCQSGNVIKTFPSLLTFALGGTLTGTTTGFAPAGRGPDHGVWNFTTGNGFSATSKAFLFAPDGTWSATQTITQVILMGDDSNQFTSDATVEFAAPNGTVFMSGCATAIGTRIE